MARSRPSGPFLTVGDLRRILAEVSANEGVTDASVVYAVGTGATDDDDEDRYELRTYYVAPDGGLELLIAENDAA